jgi:hypothetical protein
MSLAMIVSFVVIVVLVIVAALGILIDRSVEK